MRTFPTYKLLTSFILASAALPTGFVGCEHGAVVNNDALWRVCHHTAGHILTKRRPLGAHSEGKIGGLKVNSPHFHIVTRVVALVQAWLGGSLKTSVAICSVEKGTLEHSTFFGPHMTPAFLFTLLFRFKPIRSNRTAIVPSAFALEKATSKT